jgi:4-carboxymuconolactone decarboxylase
VSERLRRLVPAELDAPQSALREAIAGGPRASGPFPIVDADGSLNGPFGLMLHAPAVGAALSALGEAIRFGSSLDGRTREIAILTVGAARGSTYEVWAHERVALAMGFDAAEVQALVAGRWQPADEREAAVHEVAQLLAEGRPVGSAAADRLVQRLGEHGAVELVALVGYYLTLAHLMQVFGVEAPADGSGT